MTNYRSVGLCGCGCGTPAPGSTTRKPWRFVRGHNARVQQPQPLATRMETSIRKWGGKIPDELLWNLILGRKEDRRRREFARSLWRKYRITAEDYARMVHRQGGVCAICRKVLEDRVGGASVDHNHKTKAIRGVLCGYCNKWFLGFVERGGKERLRRAVRYLGWGVLTNNHKSRRKKLGTIVWRVA